MKIIKTCYPGRILSFDPERQVADVAIAMEQVYSDMSGFFKSMDRMPLEDLPVHFPRCKGYAITLPVEVGDDCLICFAYRGFDHWQNEGDLVAGVDDYGKPKPQVFREFDANDAFIFVGFDSYKNPITDFNSTDLEIRSRDNAQKIQLKKKGSIVLHNPSNDVEISCVNLSVNASSKVDLQTPLLNVSGKIVGGDTATFAGVTTSPNFVIGSTSYSVKGLGLGNMVDLLTHYEQHVHPYSWTDPGGSGNTGTTF